MNEGKFTPKLVSCFGVVIFVFKALFPDKKGYQNSIQNKHDAVKSSEMV